MSTWRRKALEQFNDLRIEIQHKNTTIYMLFFELLPRVRTAHANNDIEELNKIYEFAEWCSNQKSENLWNAAGVAFYEHLVDNGITYEAIPYWIKPSIFDDVKALFKNRLSELKYKELVNKYNDINKTDFE